MDVAGEESERSKVRVSFYQSVRAQSVGEQQPDLQALPVAPAMAAPEHVAPYTRQASTESGWDNPFRPDGDLSREADEIVSLIRGGKPITPTPGAPPLLDDTDAPASPLKVATPITQSPQKQVKAAVQGATKNGTSNGSAADNTPGAVDVQLSGPQQPQQPELVTLKKKPKCKCCVIQ